MLSQFLILSNLTTSVKCLGKSFFIQGEVFQKFSTIINHQLSEHLFSNVVAVRISWFNPVAIPTLVMVEVDATCLFCSRDWLVSVLAINQAYEVSS